MNNIYYPIINEAIIVYNAMIYLSGTELVRLNHRYWPALSPKF